MCISTISYFPFCYVRARILFRFFPHIPLEIKERPQALVKHVTSFYPVFLLSFQHPLLFLAHTQRLSVQASFPFSLCIIRRFVPPFIPLFTHLFLFFTFYKPVSLSLFTFRNTPLLFLVFLFLFLLPVFVLFLQYSFSFHFILYKVFYGSFLLFRVLHKYFFSSHSSLLVSILSLINWFLLIPIVLFCRPLLSHFIFVLSR